MHNFDEIDTDQAEEYPQDESGTNPFLAFTQFNAIEQSMDLQNLRVKKKGDEKYIAGKTNIDYIYSVDASRSCKFFQTKETQALIFRLDIQALRLFMYILSRLGRKSDKIKIETVLYMKLADIKSIKTFYSALNALRCEGVIAKYKGNVFWINPNVLFSGNRLEKYPDKVNVVKYIKTDKESK